MSTSFFCRNRPDGDLARHGLSNASLLPRSAILMAIVVGLWASPLKASENPPPLGSNGGCQLTLSEDSATEETEGRLRPGAEAGVFVWQTMPGDRLHCELEGFEPYDEACIDPACRPTTREIRLFPARSAELRLSPANADESEAGPLTLEWRRFGGWQEATELLAARSLGPAAGTVRLPVARDDDRLLRIRQGSASPRTFYLRAGEILEPMELELPLPRGGELLGFLEGGRYLPIALRSEARRGGSAPALTMADFGRFGAVGLPAGEYRLIADFEGGIEVPGPVITLDEGNTTELLPWQLEHGGAMEVAFDDSLCVSLSSSDGHSAMGSGASAPRVEIVRRGPSDGRLAIGQVLVTLDAGSGECSWQLHGVEPGFYDVDLLAGADARTGSLARESVRVSKDALAWTRLERARVALGGRVGLSEDRPLSDLILEAEPEAGGPKARSTTNASGEYHLDLPRPGAYAVRLLGSGQFPILEKKIRVEEGDNNHDFDLGDAGLWVRIERADGSESDEPVQVEIRTPGSIFARQSGFLAPGETEILLYDLSFESYEVRAFSESGWSSEERPIVDLSKGAPLGEVELMLVENRALLSVRDTLGRAVPGLMVAVDQTPLEESSQMGDFPLIGAVEGSEIRVLPPPDYVPVCHRLERVESTEIRLEHADSEAIIVPPPGRMPSQGQMIGFIENLPGSDCPMPISILWRPGRDADGRGVIRIPGLLPGSYTFRSLQGETLLLEVPGPPVPLSGTQQPSDSTLSMPQKNPSQTN